MLALLDEICSYFCVLLVRLQVVVGMRLVKPSENAPGSNWLIHRIVNMKKEFIYFVAIVLRF